jgi:arginyl-tRNA synthetase
MSIIDLKSYLFQTTGKDFQVSQKPDTAVLSLFDRENNVSLDTSENIVVSRIGPYLNIDLSASSYNAFLRQPFGLPVLSKIPQLFWFEYYSPNVAKQLHIGHVRNVNTGVALENLLRLHYETVITDSHLGDWGIQFGVLLWSIKKLGNTQQFEVTISEQPLTVTQELRSSDPALYYTYLYVWGNQQEANIPEFKELVREEFLKLSQGDATNTALWKSIIEHCSEANNQELALLNMRPADYVLGESNYDTAVQSLVEWLDIQGIAEQDGLARYIDYTKISADSLPDSIKPLLKALVGKDGTNELGRGYLVSSTGYTTYLSRDIAARIEWVQKYGIDRALTITDSSQNHAFRQLIVACAWLTGFAEFDKKYGNKVAEVLRTNIGHIGYGRVVLKTGKMSTRKGNFVTAKDVIDSTLTEARTILQEKNPHIDPDLLETNSQAIARAALKWNDLKTAIHQDSTFDLDTILNFDGNTGVYQLYTYARLKSILAKNTVSESADIDSSKLSPAEITLLRKLYLAPNSVTEAIKHLEPQRITNTLFDIAQSINAWYGTVNVTREEDPIRKTALLAMCQRSCEVLAILNDLLGITVVTSL